MATDAIPPGPSPRLVVISSLFPSDQAPLAGTFIRERVMRVACNLPTVVVAPQPWSPFDRLIRRWHPRFRPQGKPFEEVDGVLVFRPRAFSLPGVLKTLDGWFMARSCLKLLRREASRFTTAQIDAHFLYPDGYAAARVARRLDVPLSVTIRGSKDARLIGTTREFGLRHALQAADRIFCVSDALRRDVGTRLGVPADRMLVVGNGVDAERFVPVDRSAARERLGLRDAGPVLLTIGSLIALKGQQRVVDLLPRLKRRFSGLVYLVVGEDGGAHGTRRNLEARARALGVLEAVHFIGPQAPTELKWYYGASDVFVLATAYEGWANVLLESMACGVPVVTTDVGGNREVVSNDALGAVCPYWDADAFHDAIAAALCRPWDAAAIREHALANSWDSRTAVLVRELSALRKAGDV